MKLRSMSKRRRWGRSVGTPTRWTGWLATVAVAVAWPTPDAMAFDQYGEFCANDTSWKPKFVGSEWNESWNPPSGGGPSGFKLKDPFYWGWQQWLDQAKAFNGARALKSGEDFSLDFVQGWKIGGSGAVTICSLSNPLAAAVGGRKLAYNRDDLAKLRNNTQARNQGFSAHEAGHRFGLGHSGKSDSHGGGTPTMGTCLSTTAEYEARKDLSQDEVAAAAYLTETGQYHAVTANNSFETGVHWWGRTRVSLVQRRGGVDGSPYSAEIGPSSSGNGNIFSTTRVTNLRSVLGDGSVRGDKYNARVNYVDVYPYNTGSLLVYSRARAIVYANGFKRKCNFYGDDKNRVSRYGTWRSTPLYCYPGSNWGFCTTTRQTVPNAPGSQPSFDNPDAADTRVSVYNRTRYPAGSASSVKVDRTRIRWDF